MTRDQIAQAARAWIGTPYVHQSRRCGAGTDCLGLILGLWADLRGPFPEALPPYSMDWGEAGSVEHLWQAARRHLVPGTGMAVGHILLFRMRGGAVAKHLGVQVACDPTPSFVHAYAGHGVVESTLSAPWARRVVARFDFPDLTG